MAKPKNKKINPRRRPFSEADIDKVISNTARNMCNLFLYILIDKHDAKYEELKELAKNINYYSDSLSRGYLSWADIEKTVCEEFEIDVIWR